MKGFTGWLPLAHVNRAWASGPGYSSTHALGAEAAAPAGRARLLRLLTAATCVLNAAGQRDRLLFGGYGYLGVCLDSAAAIQQAFAGTCTLYPLVLGGDAKAALMALYAEAAAGGTWSHAAEAAALQRALARLPCDAVVEPAAAAAAARRALACLPASSPFAAVSGCRAELAAALAAAEELCPSQEA